MRPSSCKAKGRRLQQEVRDDLRREGAPYGLEPDDIESTAMGQSGVDVILSPAAKRIFPFDVEAKNVEKLNVVGVFKKHLAKYKDTPRLKLLIHSRNHTETMVTMRWSDFLGQYIRLIKFERSQDQTKPNVT